LPDDVLEVLIRAKHRQAVPGAQLREQRINGSNLDSGATARIAQGGRMDVIVPIRHQARHGRKSLENLRAP
jgi:hypothetical protein